VIAGLAVGTTVLGWFGFSGNMAALDQAGSFWDKLYLSLQLFVLQSGAVPPPVPLELEVARYLAPAITAYATLSTIAVVLREDIARLRARALSDHVIVCGLGRLGASLAKALRAEGYQVVALERDGQNGAIGECRQAGVIVLVGDATDMTLLRQASVRKARYLFAVTGDDGANAEIAIDARRLVQSRPGTPLTTFAHILDDELCELLKQRGLSARDGGSFRLEYFNAAERGATALLRDHQAFDDEGLTPLGPPHLVIVGLGQMGSRLLVQAALRWRKIRGRNGERFRVTVVDDGADDHVAALHEHYPRLKDACEMLPRRMDLDSAGFERAEFLFDSHGACDVTGVYVCVGDDARGLSAAAHLRHRLGDRDVPIVVRTTQEGGVATLFEGEDGARSHGGLEVFRLLDLVCMPAVLLRGQNEVLALAIHEDYVRHQRELGHTPKDNPSMVPWDELPETLKESNRDQAADIGRKLGAMGCDIKPLTDWDAPPLAFSSDEVELLARMEHDRWWKEREAAGWTYAPEKSEPRKESPYLVPYDDLSEDVKDYDRNTVRAMPAFLAEVGFAVIRVGQGATHG
jgi:hypothetical protein